MQSGSDKSGLEDGHVNDRGGCNSLKPVSKKASAPHRLPFSITRNCLDMQLLEPGLFSRKPHSPELVRAYSTANRVLAVSLVHGLIPSVAPPTRQ